MTRPGSARDAGRIARHACAPHALIVPEAGARHPPKIVGHFPTGWLRRPITALPALPPGVAEAQPTKARHGAIRADPINCAIGPPSRCGTGGANRSHSAMGRVPAIMKPVRIIRSGGGRTSLRLISSRACHFWARDFDCRVLLALRGGGSGLEKGNSPILHRLAMVFVLRGKGLVWLPKIPQTACAQTGGRRCKAGANDI